MKRSVLLDQEYLGILLLNLFDLFLTGFIFQHEGEEGNVVANWILMNPHLGLRGFVIYKFLLVAIFVLACEAISRKSMRKAKILTTFGAVVYAGIVLYEVYLIITIIHGGGGSQAPGLIFPSF